MTDITIPREAVEAARLAIFNGLHNAELTSRGLYEDIAKAAIAAAINAWPGMMFNGEEVIDGDVYPAIIYLVIRMEPRDE